MATRPTKAVAIAALAALGATSLWVASASGERAQEGNVIASLRGEIKPHFLPRTRAVPVSLSLSSDFSTEDRTPLPALRRIELTVGGQGQLDHRGLPICRAARIRATTWRQALSECGPALVGSGHMDGEVRIRGQAPFPFRGRMLLFNSRLRDGSPIALANVISKGPPVSFAMPFVTREPKGSGGTKLIAKLPQGVGDFVRVTHFDLSLRRRYRHRGEMRSYLNASCAVPAGFTALVLPVAQATYTFAGGQSVTVVASRGCSVRR